MTSPPMQALTHALMRLSETADVGDVVAHLATAIAEILSAERASVFRATAQGFEVLRAHGLEPGMGLPMRGFIGEAASTRQVLICNDPASDPRFNPEVDRKTGFRTTSLLTLPLIDERGTLVGALQVLNSQNGGFGDEHVEIAEAFGRAAAIAIRRAELLDQARASERMKAELDVARRIQLAALPSKLPTAPGYTILARTEPAEETGGDAYDSVTAADGSIGLLLADAAGHGVGAALAVSRVAAMFRYAIGLGGEIQSVTPQINAHAVGELPLGRFVTAFIGSLDTCAHMIRYSSAGQAPVIVRRASGELEISGASAPPLGVDAVWPEDTVRTLALAPGDALVLFSDGIAEPTIESELQGILAMLTGSDDPSRWIDQAFELSQGHNGTSRADDRTAIIVRRDR